VPHIKFDPIAGRHIKESIEQAISMAEITGVPVDLTFNGTEVRVERSHVAQVLEVWNSRRARSPGEAVVATWGVGEYVPSPPPAGGVGGSGGSTTGVKCQCGELFLGPSVHSEFTDSKGVQHSAAKCWWPPRPQP
jgi:hypothetical protein